MSEQKFWLLQEFSKLVDVHFTTLNDWSNLVEREGVHYINRASGTNRKVYDEWDLKIFRFIKSKREENWSLNAIMEILPNEFELRPFPEEFQDQKEIVTVDQLKKEFLRLMDQTLDNFKSQLIDQMDVIKESLPKPVDPEEARAQRVNQMITEFRIRNKLELEALDAWSKLPDSERFKKTGLFRKEENSLKRERFVKEYISKYFEEQLKREFGIQ